MARYIHWRGHAMNRLCAMSIALACAVGVVASGAFLAQSAYPARNVTIVVPFAPGGSSDLITRLLAKELTGQFDRPVIADNRTGGGGIVGWSAVARSPADGYTV